VLGLFANPCEFQHRILETQRLHEPLRALVLYHDRHLQNRYPLGFEFGDHGFDQCTRHTFSACGLDHVNVMHDAVLLNQDRPIPLLDRTITVAYDFALALRYHYHGFRPLDFLPEPPSIALLDVLREEETTWVDSMVETYNLGSKKCRPLNVFEGCVTNGCYSGHIRELTHSSLLANRPKLSAIFWRILL